MSEGGMEKMDMDRARQIYLANERGRAAKAAARKAAKAAQKQPSIPHADTTAADKVVITGLMKREAAEHAKYIEGTLPPRDRE